MVTEQDAGRYFPLIALDLDREIVPLDFDRA